MICTTTSRGLTMIVRRSWIKASSGVISLSQRKYCAEAKPAIEDSAIEDRPSLIPKSQSGDEILLSPNTAGNKNYSRKITSIVEEISNLTMLEVADLNSLLKVTLNISDAPVMAVGAAPAVSAASAQGEEPEEAVPVKMIFNVKLLKVEAGKKIAVIKHIKKMMEGMNLVQAKKFVETLPAVVATNVNKEKAEEVLKELSDIGAECMID